MPRTLHIGEKIKVMFHEGDFVDLVEEYMGRDARNYLTNMLDDLEVLNSAVAADREGYDEGYLDGRGEGYDEGLDAGYTSGYQAGYEAGYEDGQNRN